MVIECTQNISALYSRHKTNTILCRNHHHHHHASLNYNEVIGERGSERCDVCGKYNTRYTCLCDVPENCAKTHINKIKVFRSKIRANWQNIVFRSGRNNNHGSRVDFQQYTTHPSNAVIKTLPTHYRRHRLRALETAL